GLTHSRPQQRKAAGESQPRRRTLTGPAPALGLRAGMVALPSTADRAGKREPTMSFTSWLRNLRSGLAPSQRERKHRWRRSLQAVMPRPQLEALENGYLPSTYSVTELDLGGSFSTAADINASGQVVGI